MRIREDLSPKYGEVWGRQLDGQEEEWRGHLGQLWTKHKVGSSYGGQLLAVIAVPCSPHLRPPAAGAKLWLHKVLGFIH